MNLICLGKINNLIFEGNVHVILLFSIQLQYENERSHTAKHCGATAPNPLLSSALWCWAVGSVVWTLEIRLASPALDCVPCHLRPAFSPQCT